MDHLTQTFPLSTKHIRPMQPGEYRFFVGHPSLTPARVQNRFYRLVRAAEEFAGLRYKTAQAPNLYDKRRGILVYRLTDED